MDKLNQLIDRLTAILAMSSSDTDLYWSAELSRTVFDSRFDKLRNEPFKLYEEFLTLQSETTVESFDLSDLPNSMLTTLTAHSVAKTETSSDALLKRDFSAQAYGYAKANLSSLARHEQKGRALVSLEACNDLKSSIAITNTESRYSLQAKIIESASIRFSSPDFFHLSHSAFHLISCTIHDLDISLYRRFQSFQIEQRKSLFSPFEQKKYPILDKKAPPASITLTPDAFAQILNCWRSDCRRGISEKLVNENLNLYFNTLQHEEHVDVLCQKNSNGKVGIVDLNSIECVNKFSHLKGCNVYHWSRPTPISYPQTIDVFFNTTCTALGKVPICGGIRYLDSIETRASSEIVAELTFIERTKEKLSSSKVIVRFSPATVLNGVIGGHRELGSVVVSDDLTVGACFAEVNFKHSFTVLDTNNYENSI